MEELSFASINVAFEDVLRHLNGFASRNSAVRLCSSTDGKNTVSYCASSLAGTQDRDTD
jgi:hypothetical protein